MKRSGVLRPLPSPRWIIDLPVSHKWQVRQGVGGSDLRRKKYAMPECVCVEIMMQTNSNCVKNETFTILTSDETCTGSYIERLHTQ